MGRPPTPTIRRWQLGQELRRLREAAGIRPSAAAAEIEVSPATLSKIETGKQQIKPLYVKLLAGLYGVASAERAALLELAEEANRPEWFVALASRVPTWFRQYLGYEAAATEIRTYGVELITGLMQTEEYARAIGIANTPAASGRDLDSYVALRRGRQERLVGDGGPTLHAVINEAALRHHVGGTEVMRAQLVKLVDLSRLEHVRIQVLPLSVGAHPAMTSPFTMLGFEIDEMATVYLENGRGAVYLDGAADLERYGWIFDQLTAVALSPDASRSWLDRVASDL